MRVDICYGWPNLGRCRGVVESEAEGRGLASEVYSGHASCVQKITGAKSKNDRAARIYRRLKGMRGVDESELWQHALFFAMTPQERCRFSLKTARSVLAMRHSNGRLPANRLLKMEKP